jgi:predicted O-methyltransferase YrrM
MSLLMRPRSGRRHLAEAQGLARAGDAAGARAAAMRALRADAGLDEARRLICALELADFDYLHVLRALHARLRPQTYLEIGVGTGDSLRLAAPSTHAVGVDPAPALTALAGPHHVHRATSDEFFRAHRRADVFDAPVDLAFIDGMHRFEAALRDVVNVERWSRPGSVIAVHDTYPVDAISADRRSASPEVTRPLRRALRRATNRYSEFWTGDVWRLLIALRAHRPDLRIVTVPAQPSGLTLISDLDPRSEVLTRGYRSIVSSYLRLELDVLIPNRRQVLSVTDEPLDACLAIGSRPPTSTSPPGA